MSSTNPHYELKVCGSCRVRYRVAPLAPRDYNTVPLSRGQLMLLERAAAAFDAAADEKYTAIEFIQWMRPDVPGTPEYRATRRGQASKDEEAA